MNRRQYIRNGKVLPYMLWRGIEIGKPATEVDVFDALNNAPHRPRCARGLRLIGRFLACTCDRESRIADRLTGAMNLMITRGSPAERTFLQALAGNWVAEVQGYETRKAQ